MTQGSFSATDSFPSVVPSGYFGSDGRLTFPTENETVALPFINLMRRQGSLFLNAYTNSPICCPSRAAMWSGLFTHLTESWNNFKGLDPNYTTWMDLMEKKGYYTKKYGKLDYTSGHHSLSNRVEAWTRNVDFLLQQEGRPVAKLIGNKTYIRVMQKDWKVTEEAANWIKNKATKLSQPFALYLGLNLPHPYPSPSSGENYGASTFLTSPYWLQKVIFDAIKIPKWPPFSEMHPVDYYSTFTKNCSGQFTQEEIRNIRAHYYAMCAETDAMLEIASIPIPKNISGYSLMPLILEKGDYKALSRRRRPPWILSEFHGCNVNSSTYMLRIDKWKYIAYSDSHSVSPQLFAGSGVQSRSAPLKVEKGLMTAILDLSNDPDELTDVAAKFPAITQSLNKKLYHGKAFEHMACRQASTLESYFILK
ncbi:Arylsulfatase K, partial [Ophiophagus hannah]